MAKRPKFSTHRYQRVVHLILMVFAVSLLGGGCQQNGTGANGHEASKKGDRPIVVAVEKVRSETVPITLSALGTVNSNFHVTIRSRVDGQLQKIHFSEGQFVKAGQLLAELDPRPFQATLAQTQGQLLRDTALLKNAQLDLSRYETLWGQNSIAKQQLDTQRALVNQYEGSVKIDQANVENAKLQLEYSRITAPVSGRLGLRMVDPGNMVRSNDTTGLVTLTQTQPIYVLFALPQAHLGKVLEAMRTNPQLPTQAWDQDNQKQVAQGTLSAIDNQLNTATGTINLKAQFDNLKTELFPNQFVNIRLQLGDLHDALTVPNTALQSGKEGSFVYVVQADDTVRLTPVKTGIVFNESTVITQGLSLEDRVVIDGLDKLRNGARIQTAQRATDTEPLPAPGNKHSKNPKK